VNPVQGALVFIGPTGSWQPDDIEGQRLSACTTEAPVLPSVSRIQTRFSRNRTPVTIVTLDINMQNKAEMASLPFVEPPSE